MAKHVGGMTKILDGVRIFQNHVFDSKAELFEKLDKGQNPLVLFITCSDSRINPNLLTQTEPGELFIIRNAGNIVPPYGAGGGEEATIEYAVMQLKVRHIVVCGHSTCGAVQGLLDPSAVATMPSVSRWLHHSDAVVEELRKAGDLPPHERQRLAIEKNTLVQLDHLQTHPSVKKALDKHELKLQAWVYHIGTGEIQVHDAANERFVPFASHHRRTQPGEDEVPVKESLNWI